AAVDVQHLFITGEYGIKVFVAETDTLARTVVVCLVRMLLRRCGRIAAAWGVVVDQSHQGQQGGFATERRSGTTSDSGHHCNAAAEVRADSAGLWRCCRSVPPEAAGRIRDRPA